MTEEKYWDDAKVGDECITPSVTVTEQMVNAYAELTGDFTPVHVDEEYAKKTPFGTRVAHGLFGLSLADGLKTRADYRFLPGMSLGWTWDFKLPIKLGDTVHVKFRVGSMRTTKREGWGIVVLPSELINQRGEVVQLGEHRLMIPMAAQAGRQQHEQARICRSKASASSTTAISWPARSWGAAWRRWGAEVIKVERPKAGDPGARTRISRTDNAATSCSRTWASRACASTCATSAGST